MFDIEMADDFIKLHNLITLCIVWCIIVAFHDFNIKTITLYTMSTTHDSGDMILLIASEIGLE